MVGVFCFEKSDYVVSWIPPIHLTLWFEWEGEGTPPPCGLEGGSKESSLHVG